MDRRCKDIILIVEKEDVAKQIADVYGISKGFSGEYIAGNFNIIHLNGNIVSLLEPKEKWSIDNLPLEPTTKKEIKKEFEALFNQILMTFKRIIGNGNEIIIVNGCDAGREGQLIFRWLMEEVAKNIKIDFKNTIIKRLWMKSLTEKAITDALGIRRKTIINDEVINPNYLLKLEDDNSTKFNNLYESAEARSYLDAYMGFNYTRLFTKANEKMGTDNFVITYGRCQSPILNAIYEREVEISSFIKEKYYEIEVTLSNELKLRMLDMDKEPVVIKEIEHLEYKNRLLGKEIKLASVNEKIKSYRPPKLYSLIELQKDMSKKYNFSPQKTLDLAQKLYMKGLITYPRTDNEYLTSDYIKEMDNILESIRIDVSSEENEFFKIDNLKEYIDKRPLAKISHIYFNDEVKSDHHAIIPTAMSLDDKLMSLEAMGADEQRLFNQIAKRLISTYYDNFQILKTKYLYEYDNMLFSKNTSDILVNGFGELYENTKNAKVDIITYDTSRSFERIVEVNLKEKTTTPPKRYKAYNLLNLMKTYKIGTSATQASIIQSLVNSKKGNLDGYLKLEQNGYYTITDLGKKVVKYIPNELLTLERASNIDGRLLEIENISNAKETSSVLKSDIKNEFIKYLSDIKEILEEK